MSAEDAISLDALNAASPEQFAAALRPIYEHSPWVAEAVAARRPFATVAALHAALRDALMRADDSRQLALIRAHPDLAGKAARAGMLTADSTVEQLSAGLDRLSADEFDTFQRLNETYRTTFGFPFIVCVRRHTKESIFRQFERRLGNTPAAERETALNEIVRIAALRLDRHVRGPDRLPVNGRLSTHVLDTWSGRPAAGVAIELHELSGAGRLVLSTRTNADGRTERPLIEGSPVPIGRYELRFALGDYFARCGASLPEPAFLDVVPVRFAVAEPETHYHVPLLASPWSYSTYRGS